MRHTQVKNYQKLRRIRSPSHRPDFAHGAGRAALESGEVPGVLTLASAGAAGVARSPPRGDH
jgi:hypothetical protein